MNNFLEVGRIVAVQGLSGEVRVQPWCDSAEFLCEFEKLFFAKGEKKITVTKARAQKNLAILKIEGIDTPEAAAKLRNQVLYINKEDIELGENTYFVQDLIGLDVIDIYSKELYGKLVDVSETGANDVYHIKAEDNKMYYIPAIPQVVIETNIQDGKMLIRPLKGLFDDED